MNHTCTAAPVSRISNPPSRLLHIHEPPPAISPSPSLPPPPLPQLTAPRFTVLWPRESATLLHLPPTPFAPVPDPASTAALSPSHLHRSQSPDPLVSSGLLWSPLVHGSGSRPLAAIRSVLWAVSSAAQRCFPISPWSLLPSFAPLRPSSLLPQPLLPLSSFTRHTLLIHPPAVLLESFVLCPSHSVPLQPHIYCYIASRCPEVISTQSRALGSRHGQSAFRSAPADCRHCISPETLLLTRHLANSSPSAEVRVCLDPPRHRP